MQKTNLDVILVDETDTEIGVMEKLEAHQKGALHRAFSIFLFNDQNQMLIHKRALNKYHSAGLWTNTCCSHPIPNEDLFTGLKRRLNEELNIVYEHQLDKAYQFIYKTELENNLIEHELDYVFVGRYNSSISPNHEEVMDWKYVDINSLYSDIKGNPNKYTFWFKEILNDQRFIQFLNHHILKQ